MPADLKEKMSFIGLGGYALLIRPDIIRSEMMTSYSTTLFPLKISFQH